MNSIAQPIVLDRTLVTDLGNNYNVGPELDLFGIEVELEGRKINTNKESITKYWGVHADGSLRVFKPGAEACEYVFKKPLDMLETQRAIAVLFEYLTKNPGTEVFDSYRTSIHVHVNCLNDTIRTIVNFLTLSIIFDELFVSQNGETRTGNNFCLRSRDAEGQITDLINSVRKGGTLYNLSVNDRYSSVNFSSLLKFGTVEFRSLECTTDYDRVIHWIKTLQALKTASRQYEDPREIISKFSRRGPMGFMISHLGSQYEKYASVPGSHQLLHNGMRLAQDFAFCSDWRQPLEGSKQIKPKVKMGAPAGAVANYAQHLAQIAAMAQMGPQPVGLVNQLGGDHWAGWNNPFAEAMPVGPGAVVPEEDEQADFGPMHDDDDED